MLILKFQIGTRQFAVDSKRVIEVIPWVNLQPIPRAPSCWKGMFHYRGQAITVIDLAELMGAEPCQARLSTRIIVVQHQRQQLALLAERVSDLANVDKGAWSTAAAVPGAPYLGPILKEDAARTTGLIQLIDVDRIVSDDTQQSSDCALSRPD